MTRTVYTRWPTGQTLYAKPSPMDADPTWADDVVAFAEVDATGQYSGSIADGHHEVFLQAGGSPASSDQAIGEFLAVGLAGAYTVTFTVLDEDTDPVENAVIRLYNASGSETQNTNASGVRAFSVDAATWSYSIRYPGFTSQVSSAVISDDTAVPITLVASGADGSDVGWIG